LKNFIKQPGRMNSEHIDTQMVKVEVSLDDMNPEFYGYIIDQLLQMGANDAYLEQVVMKKNRPGLILNVLCWDELKDDIVAFLFRETTTLGVRYTPYYVHRLEREFKQVTTDWGDVTVKIGKFKGEVTQIAPEYDECARIAREFQIPLKIVYDTVKMLGMKFYWGNK